MDNTKIFFTKKTEISCENTNQSEQSVVHLSSFTTAKLIVVSCRGFLKWKTFINMVVQHL